MAESIELLVASALQLPPNQRLELAGRILSSMELSSSSAADATWDKEIRARIAQYDSGAVQGIPAELVFAEARQRLKNEVRISASSDSRT